jgi:CHAT domain-containing protein
VAAASTTVLRVEFHRGRAARPRGPAADAATAAALRQAALRLLRGPKYRHPFYWAGFVLVGDGS